MHRIIVFGASGRTGAQVVAQAVARGDDVTAFVRNPSKVKGLPKEAKVIKGDGLDPVAVAAAVAGHDSVIMAVGNRNTYVSAPITRNVVAGMKAAGVRRVIAVSAYGAGDSGHGLQGFIFKRVLRKLNADKMETERLLVESGLDWTAVRPVTLTEKPANGRISAAVDVVVNGFRGISRTDLANFILGELDRNAFVRKRPIVAAA